MLTSKQKTTLKYFALNYSIWKIATKQNVSVSTIRSRLRSISKTYTTEFNNACGIRAAYKRAKYNLKYSLNFEDINQESIKYVF